MGILNTVFGNTRKPQGRIGKMMAKSMNSGHAKMADWGMAFLADVEASSITKTNRGSRCWRENRPSENRTAEENSNPVLGYLLFVMRNRSTALPFCG